MADAKEDKTQTAGSGDVKKATADAAQKAEDSRKAAATADEKAGGATGSRDDKAKDTAAPKSAARGKPADKADQVEAKNQAESATPETKENREANAAPAPVGPQPEFVLDEKHNRRPGPEENPENKAFPDPDTGTHNAPLEKNKSEAKRMAGPADPLSLKLRNPHAALQEDQQWQLNREQATVTSTDTPAGDSSPAPEGVESANWVDTPARAHTLSEPDDSNTADSVGQRLRRAADSARLEERPDRRGIHSDELPGNYTVEDELRLQWPGIHLGDEEAPAETSPDKD